MPKRGSSEFHQLDTRPIKRHKSTEQVDENSMGSSKPYGVPIPFSKGEKERISHNTYNSNKCLNCDLSSYNYNYSVLHGPLFNNVRCTCKKII